MHLKTKKNAFTLQELTTLLLKAKEGDYTFYLFLLLAAVTGARVSETRALCFRNILQNKNLLLIVNWDGDMTIKATKIIHYIIRREN